MGRGKRQAREGGREGWRKRWKRRRMKRQRTRVLPSLPLALVVQEDTDGGGTEGREGAKEGGKEGQGRPHRLFS